MAGYSNLSSHNFSQEKNVYENVVSREMFILLSLLQHRHERVRRNKMALKCEIS